MARPLGPRKKFYYDALSLRCSERRRRRCLNCGLATMERVGVVVLVRCRRPPKDGFVMSTYAALRSWCEGWRKQDA